ncbi:MAG: HAMP domain-containing histidine kinase [Lachnospiraceae bacterium]|nr:HAMP domain-containing histidine kinase [Lachnospiraceae bacterium]
MPEKIILGIACFMILAAVLTVFLYCRHTKRVMRNLDAMLDAAINGTFTEETLDETMYSAVENKLGRYLADSELSARNVAEEKEKIKTLIADISHQTKTPVSNLLLYSDLLREQELSGEAEEYVEKLYEQADKLHFLISSLVKMSRLETGIVSLVPAWEHVEEVIEFVCRQLEPKAADKGIELIVRQGRAAAYFDKKWTTEALLNLVDNAIKYTSEGCVTLKIKEYEMFVCIEVEDTGIGITEEEQAKIFGRFYRSNIVKDEEGVGLGLYLARQIISGEGGYIKVKSKPGEGSVFGVYLGKQKR